MTSELFTPISSLVGGSLIGLSAGSLLIFNGDVLGASGILNSVVTTPHETFRQPSLFWKSTLLSSFLVTSTVLFGPAYAIDTRAETDAGVPIASAIAFSLSGFLVGLGTRLGNGCTSGHGVCGLGRRSQRSLTAVLTFLTTAIGTTAITSPNSSLAEYTTFLRTDTPTPLNPSTGAVLTSAVVFATMMSFRNAIKSLTAEHIKKSVVGAVSGALFAAGLVIGNMVLGSKLFGFMDVGSIPIGKWDPSLAVVLTAAVGISTLSYEFVHGFSLLKSGKELTKPVVASKFSVPTNTTIDKQLVVGAAIFGVGWGIGLICPAPALFHAAVGNTDVIFRWLPAFIVGSLAGQQLKR